MSTKETNSRARHELYFGLPAKDLKKVSYGRERCRHVCVPVPDELGITRKCIYDAQTDGLCLPEILGQFQAPQ